MFGWAFILNGNRPIWVARWTQLRKSLKKVEPSSWNSAVGVFRSRRTLQLVLRYAASGVRLVRPTQLDIGYYAFHFPSPSTLDKSRGGFAMSLHDYGVTRPPELISEYIHPPRQFQFADWLSGGAWFGEHSGEDLDRVEIGLFRTQHAERLLRKSAIRGNPDSTSLGRTDKIHLCYTPRMRKMNSGMVGLGFSYFRSQSDP